MPARDAKGCRPSSTADQRLRNEGRRRRQLPRHGYRRCRRSQAATRAAMVLSDLLARADTRAGELAKAYYHARLPGQLGEASYNALTN